MPALARTRLGSRKSGRAAANSSKVSPAGDVRRASSITCIQAFVSAASNFDGAPARRAKGFHTGEHALAGVLPVVAGEIQPGDAHMVAIPEFRHRQLPCFETLQELVVCHWGSAIS